MTNKLNCILLIDDDADDNFFHQIALREINAAETIHVVTNGFDALEYLTNDNHIPDLIFLDINMPKMNGWEFLKEYDKLNIEQQAKVVIIMLTTSLNPSDRENATTMNGITDFRTKPLTVEMVEEIIRNYF